MHLETRTVTRLENLITKIISENSYFQIQPCSGRGKRGFQKRTKSTKFEYIRLVSVNI